MTSISEESGSFRTRTLAAPRLASFREFLETEAGGAVVLLTATVTALVWANSPWAASYPLVATDLSISLGSLHLALDLGHWVNDGLMTLFFLVIGLEVRREFDRGELRERRRAALPLIAGLGGMAVPALLFLSLNPDGEAARGWAMVMATDTAFALGILALAGRRCPLRLRIFLLTLVVVDDVGAITIIALVYSSSVPSDGCSRPRARWSRWPCYAEVAWRARFPTGCSASWRGPPRWRAGCTPRWPAWLSGSPPAPTHRACRPSSASGLARAFREQPSAALAAAAARRITRSLSPNERLQHALHPWTSFVVVPLFALPTRGSS